ncbi:MAG: hypothetical protein H7X84_04210 [Verrucomicrobia bacterium]|nr:hypothetical protein [Prolixibacteraceae bacterium]
MLADWGKGQGAWITEDELVVDSLRLATNPINQGKLPFPQAPRPLLHAPF